MKSYGSSYASHTEFRTLPDTSSQSFTVQDKSWQNAILAAGTLGHSSLNGLMKAYVYDKTGEMRQTRHSLQGDMAHGYDATGRVLQSVRKSFSGMPAANNEQFEYEPAGNILDNQTQAQLRSRTQYLQAGYVRDNLVRVLEDKRFYYDGHGRLICKLSGKHTAQTFRWDGDNNLVEVLTTRRPGTEHARTQIVRFDYDAIGRRIAKHDHFGTTIFIWEGMRLIEERRGSAVISYVYEPDSYVPLARLDADGELTQDGGLGTQADLPVEASDTPTPMDLHRRSTEAANVSLEGTYWQALSTQHQTLSGTGTDDVGNKLCNVYYFHTDQVGTPQKLSNEQGQLVWQASYKTWDATVAEEWQIKALEGQRVHALDQGNIPDNGALRQQNLRFQGQYLDRETGLHYNAFRYYDPDVGRFVCPDPIGLQGGINLGIYAPNPIAWIDPWGLAVVDATFEMGGEVFNGTNPTERPNRAPGPTVSGMAGPNADRFGMHAEIDAMIQAHDKGLSGGKGVLTVEGKEMCSYCKRSLKNMAKHLGLDEFIIHEKATGKTYNFKGPDLDKVRLGGKGFKTQC